MNLLVHLSSNFLWVTNKVTSCSGQFLGYIKLAELHENVPKNGHKILLKVKSIWWREMVDFELLWHVRVNLIVSVLIREKLAFARAHAELTLPLNDVKSRQDSSYLKGLISGSGSSYFWELGRVSRRKVRAHVELTLLLK